MGNLPERLERLPLSRFHLRLFGISAGGWMFDSIDLAMLSFVLPVIIKEWGLSGGAAGFVATATFLGMFVGASFGGYAADRWGRKTVFQVTLVWYSVAALLNGLAWDYTSFVVFRFLLGVGMGGEFPVVITYLSEFLSKKRRGAWLNLMEGFWVMGLIVASLVALLLIPPFGWRSVFIIMVVPAAYIGVIRRWLPESPRWLVSKGRAELAEEVVNGIEEEVEKSTGKPLPPPELTKAAIGVDTTSVPVRELFAKGFARRTVMLWIFMFAYYFGYYAITTWLPAILVAKGYTLVSSYSYFLFMTVFGIPGFVTTYFLIEKIGRRATLGIFGVIGVGGALMMANAGGITSLLAWGALMQFGILGYTCVLYAYTPEQYSTRMRATGSGAAWSIGRIGSLSGPLVAGLIINSMGPSAILNMGGVLILVSMLSAVILGTETKGRTLEELTETSSVGLSS